MTDNYAKVFRCFSEASPSISRFIRAAQFRTLVDERTRGFIGRQFVFDAIDSVTSGKTFAAGYALMRGEPGIGKTAIAAAYATTGGHVHHFNIASANIRSPRLFLENVCAQLIARYQLDHPTLAPDAGQDPGFLSQLLLEAVDRARERDELPVVVVVDALDEADDAELAPGANRLYLPRSLPAGVFFVVTTRETTDFRLNVDHAADIWIRKNDPANQEDVARYIERFIEEHPDSMKRHIADWGLSPPDFSRWVTKRSEGNFMYLVHVLPAIAMGKLTRATVGDIRALPLGLKGYYERHWGEMKDADPVRFKEVQRPVLCFLAVSLEPVTALDLAAWARVEPGDVRRLVDEWREFLNEEPDSRPPLFRIYHRSFAEFLDDREDLTWYHDQIARTALKKIPGFLEA